jgi:23S rRNA pseudouridine955/2504/2580 synthase
VTNPNDQSTSARFVTVDENSVGQRLDNFLRKELVGVPKTYIYRVLRKGEVRVNKGRKKPDYKLLEGDIVRVPPTRTATREEIAKLPSRLLNELSQRIVYEDDGLLILNKPAGLAVHGGSGVTSTALAAVRQLRPNQEYLELAHRLDRPTSGCLVFAKSRESLQAFLHELQNGGVDKRYMAIVAGAWNDAGWIEHKLKRGEGEDRRVVSDDEGKDARSYFRPLEIFQPKPFAQGYGNIKFTLLEVQLDTGRTHQIRAHAAEEGKPLIGDDKYGDFPLNKALASVGCKRLCLHAHSLSFLWRGEKLVVNAEMDDDMRQVLSL